MFKYFLIINLFFSSLFAEFYYTNGKQQDLTPVKTIRSQSLNSIKYYKTDRDKTIGVTDKIIVGFIDISAKKSIEKRFNLSLFKQLSPNIFLYSAKSSIDALTLSNQLYQLKEVKFAHPDFLIKKERRTTDPLYPKAWHLKNNGDNVENITLKKGADINVEEAWKITKGEGVKVAIVDDAIDINHEDLKENIEGYRNYQDPSIDDPAPLEGSGNWHGTSCAGLISALENDKGSVGVAPSAKLYAVKYQGSLVSKDIEAFNWLNSEGVDVISNSWGSYNLTDAFNETLKELAEKGRNGRGMLITFAAGNDTMSLDEPGIYDESESPYVLAISATDETDMITSYSNYGNSIDFAAPGSEHSTIVTIDVTGTLGYENGNYTHHFNGTSASSPIVAGTIALILSANPNLTREEVIEILQTTSKKVGDEIYQNGRNDYYGYGRVDAGEAVKLAYLYKNDFLKKVYEYILGREADPGGFTYWTEQLAKGKSAAEIIISFFNSPEYQEQHNSIQKFIESAYQIFFDKKPDDDVRDYWINQIENGSETTNSTLYQFAFSNKFTELCKAYKVLQYNQDDQLKAFLENLYAVILGRNSDNTGMNYWLEKLKSGEKNEDDIREAFYNSEEFINNTK